MEGNGLRLGDKIIYGLSDPEWMLRNKVSLMAL